MKKRNFRLTTIFSFSIFLVLFFTTPTAFILDKISPSDFLSTIHPILRPVVLSLLSITCGYILTKYLSKSTLNSIKEINDATKEIANGNYNIRLKEKSRLHEINSITHNFNVMAKDLATTDIMRNDFITNVSHEFKTPLTAIEGYATLLQNENLTKEETMEYTQNIIINSKRLSKMTGNILLLSKLDNQETAIKKEDFQLDEQLREIILLFEKEWVHRNINLDIELASITYKGNKELLSHVWLNIFGNALKFTDDNTTICVCLYEAEKNIVVSIKDNGKGISKENIDKIFEKFYQEDSSRKSSGNGLGLSIVKKIVDLHKGKLTVESEIKQGTTFNVFLPKSV